MTTATLNVSKVHSAALSNETALAIAESLSDAQRRNRKKTNLLNIYRGLKSKGLKIVPSDFNQFWKDLQAAGAGSIIYGRNGNSDRFSWNYNLKNVATAALTGSETTPMVAAPIKVPKKRGRPVGSKNKKVRTATPPSSNIEMKKYLSSLTEALLAIAKTTQKIQASF